jgi:hypothetical protein
MSMHRYRITSRAWGMFLGTFAGTDPKDATAAMLRECGYLAAAINGVLVTEESAPSFADLEVEEDRASYYARQNAETMPAGAYS